MMSGHPQTMKLIRPGRLADTKGGHYEYTNL